MRCRRPLTPWLRTVERIPGVAVLLLREKPHAGAGGGADVPARPARVTGVRTLSGSDRAPSGLAGLDDILGGGFVLGRLHLVEGKAGTGKTTLGMQFVLAGRDRGEKVLYVSMSETRDELQAVAVTHGWSLEGIEIFELVPPDAAEGDDNRQTMFRPSEVELGETMRLLCGEIERIDPARIVLNSLSEMRLLAQNPLRYRRQIFALKHFLGPRRATVLMIDDVTSESHDLQLHSIVARRGHLGGVGARLRRGAAAVAGDENARGQISRRLS